VSCAVVHTVYHAEFQRVIEVEAFSCSEVHFPYLMVVDFDFTQGKIREEIYFVRFRVYFFEFAEFVASLFEPLSFVCEPCCGIEWMPYFFEVAYERTSVVGFLVDP